MNDKILNLLGLARRANAISLGHDAAVESILGEKAALCVVAADASQRLKDEMQRTCEKINGKTEVWITEYTMDELGMCMGAKKTAVCTVNNAGFAQKIKKLIREVNGLYGKEI